MSVRRYVVNVNVDVTSEGDVTIVEAYVNVDKPTEHRYIYKNIYARDFSANSKRNPVDKNNPDAGVLIALGRVLKRAGNRLEKVGDGFNKNDADTVAERKKSALRGNQKHSKVQKEVLKEEDIYD